MPDSDRSATAQAAVEQAEPTRLLLILPRRDAQKVMLVREQLCQLALNLYVREPAHARSIGFTSSVPGEGKTFMAMLTARVLAAENFSPITLIDLNWEHAMLDAHFGLATTPGVAEWLRGEAEESAIRHAISDTLTVITAGDGRRDAILRLGQMRQQGSLNRLGSSGGLMIVDLPAILTCGYGILAASLVDALTVVVHSGVTTDQTVAQTCNKLESLPFQGVILNQVSSRIPGWILDML